MSKKFHVVCVLPNASLLINGIEFVQVDKESIMTADPVEAHVALMFDGIPGYSLSELEEEDQAAIEAARQLEAQARSRAAATARRATAAAKAAVAAAAKPPEPAEPTPAPEAAADVDKPEGESEGEQGEAADAPQGEGEPAKSAEELF